MRFLTILGIICFFSLSLNAQIRVLNDEKKWIILMPDGSWHYDEAEKKETKVEPSGAATIKSKSQELPVKVESPVSTPSTKVVIVDGVEKNIPNSSTKKDTLPSPPAGMEYRTIMVDGVEKSILVQSSKKIEVPLEIKPKTPSTEPNKTAFEELGTPVPPLKSDSTVTPKAVTEVHEGSEFLTPEEEYRLKAAATQAGTAQNDNIKIKPEKVKSKKQPKPEKVVVKEVKKPKAAAAGCELTVNEIDEFTGKEKKSTKSRVFFTHTPEAAKKYMRSEDYLTCTGYLSRVGAYKTLNLTIVVDSPYGQTEYGEISNNSSLMIRMIDGSTVELYCDKGDAGHVDKIKNQTIYNIFYILESSFEAQLKRGEVSRARLVWSVGFEDYELYNLDFFTEQLGCIN